MQIAIAIFILEFFSRIQFCLVRFLILILKSIKFVFIKDKILKYVKKI